MSNVKSNVKKRNWGVIVYPESAPGNWREILQQTGLQCAISPLHDKDTDPDEKEKKAHYHVIVVYSTGSTTFNVVKKLTDSLNAPIPQPLEQVRGYYRYFTHQDNPEKYQYSEADITTINGFYIGDYVEKTASEKVKLKMQIMDVIEQNDIVEYSRLLKILKKDFDMFDVASCNTLLFNTYITSRRHEKENVNQETGEIKT
jgi:hypothetical protein